MTEDRPEAATYPQAPPPAPGEPPIAGFTRRHGLVRPRQGRLLAGVCAGFGRATNTDPVLWRVLLAVLALFGVGILVYLIGWLLMPSEGDTGAPLEAAFGRGRSGTPTALTIIVAVITVVSLSFMIGDQPRPFALALLAVGGVALLLMRDQRGRAPVAAAPPPPPAPTTESTTEYPQPYPPAVPYPPTAPYAPHGPYAPLGPPPPQPPPVYVPPPPKPPKPRSVLGKLTFSLALIAVGVVALLDLTDFHVPASAYLAAGLAAVGVGLVVGAWFGRARGMIGLGIVLSVALLITTGAERYGDKGFGESVNWHPTSVAELQDRYRHDLGDATLDLRDVDFSTGDVTVNVDLDLGSLRVLLPEKVDVTVDAKVDLGHARVFDDEWGGAGGGRHKVVDTGSDGAGGGELTLFVNVDLGDLEVQR